MAARDLHVYAQSLGGQLCHYRDNSGLEIDSIIELDNGGYAAIEVKLGADQEDEAAANLIRFARKDGSGRYRCPRFPRCGGGYWRVRLHAFGRCACCAYRMSRAVERGKS